LGTIRDGEKIIDEVLVSLFVGPRSFTKENVVEISTHGSSYIINQVLKLFVRMGVRLAKPGEFTQRAFLNGQFDLAQAEAVADLIHSDSESSHQAALNQMRGGFSSEIQELRNQLIHFASMIELELDFSEEDVEFVSREGLRKLVERILRLVEELILSFDLGNVIKNGVPTVIAGKPNAGKSTLLNALLNEEKAIVSDIAGTTRDFIEDELSLGGVIFRFIDTAGLRETTDTIEAIGVSRTQE
jgi:tRNA modification GTPase